jgi:hypothetical protein
MLKQTHIEIVCLYGSSFSVPDQLLLMIWQVALTKLAFSINQPLLAFAVRIKAMA